MEYEDSETTSLEYRTVNDRAGGRLQAKYDRQQTGDAEPASAASRAGELNAGQGRVTAMSQRRTTGEAKIGDRVQYHGWASNTGERRRQANAPERVNALHNKGANSRLGKSQVP